MAGQGDKNISERLVRTLLAMVRGVDFAARPQADLVKLNPLGTRSTKNHAAYASIADRKRLGIMGGSYGGYMVMAGVTEFPDMFAAAADLVHREPGLAALSRCARGCTLP